MPVAEPGGEVVAGAVVVGEECSEGGAGLVGVLVDGLALEADGAARPFHMRCLRWWCMDLVSSQSP